MGRPTTPSEAHRKRSPNSRFTSPSPYYIESPPSSADSNNNTKKTRKPNKERSSFRIEKRKQQSRSTSTPIPESEHETSDYDKGNQHESADPEKDVAHKEATKEQKTSSRKRSGEKDKSDSDEVKGDARNSFGSETRNSPAKSQRRSKRPSTSCASKCSSSSLRSQSSASSSEQHHHYPRRPATAPTGTSSKAVTQKVLVRWSNCVISELCIHSFPNKTFIVWINQSENRNLTGTSPLSW